MSNCSFSRCPIIEFGVTHEPFYNLKILPVKNQWERPLLEDWRVLNFSKVNISSDCNGTRTHNYIVRKQTLDHWEWSLSFPWWSQVFIELKDVILGMPLRNKYCQVSYSKNCNFQYLKALTKTFLLEYILIQLRALDKRRIEDDLDCWDYSGVLMKFSVNFDFSFR